MKYSGMTYKQALELAGEVLMEKQKKIEAEDTLGLGLSDKYNEAIILLNRIWMKDII